MQVGICLSLTTKAARMIQSEPTETTATEVAVLGTGKLVQTSKGRLALHGGTSGDFVEAKEWVSMFMPGRVIHREKSGGP
jgi:hypothetical protein